MWDEEQWAKAQAVKKDPREKAKGLCPEDLEAETLPKGHSAQRRSKHAPLPRKSKGSRRLADSDDEQSEDSDDEVTDDAVQGASRSEPASRHPMKTKAQGHQATNAAVAQGGGGEDGEDGEQVENVGGEEGEAKPVAVIAAEGWENSTPTTVITGRAHTHPLL